MGHVQPKRTEYRYAVSMRPDGTPYVGQYAEGASYYNVLSWRSDMMGSNTYRIIARTPTLEKAERLVQALNECTQA